MTEPAENANPVVDWEAFYQNYRRPDYIRGYEITSKLGGGMFGLVFKACKQSIGKDYAIKFLKVEDDSVRRAVVGELDAVQHFAQVDHPNLVAIEDRGEVDGIPYLVMTYAGDSTLRDRLDDPDHDREDLLLFFLQACRGVHALHERSLVHFDLKPANVFIRGSVARVGDYGLSKLVAHSRNTLSMGRGTPYYMAPEMLQQRGDARSDIYSLGVVLYECLTGDVPFKGDSEWEVLRKHEREAPSFPDDMPELYRSVLTRCLAKDPADRFQSVKEILDAFDLGDVVDYVRDRDHATPPPSDTDAGESRPRHETPDDEGYSHDALKKAAREFSEQAKLMASEAVKSARVVGERAVADAKRAMRRHGIDQSWAEELRKKVRLREKLDDLRWHRARRGHGRITFVLRGGISLMIVLGVLAVAFLTVAGTRRAPRVVSSEPGARPVAVSGAGQFATPSEYLESFRKSLPTAPEDHRLSWVYPSVELPEVSAMELNQAQLRLRGHLWAEKWPSGLTSDLGYPGVRAALAMLQAESLADPDSARRAARLNRYLQNALSFDGIRVLAEDYQRGYALNSRAPEFWRMLIANVARGPSEYAEYVAGRER